MENIEAIEFTGPDRAIWTVRAPAGTKVQFETEIVDVVEDSVISWRSTETSAIKTEGRVSFVDAPGQSRHGGHRGHRLCPPAGDLGRIVAKLFMAEPNIQARHELKRFKMLMEAGEIATPINHRA
jgi:uncharacterized membrane protein